MRRFSLPGHIDKSGRVAMFGENDVTLLPVYGALHESSALSGIAFIQKENRMEN